MTLKQIIKCAAKRSFILSKSDALDIRDNWAVPSDTLESALCSWLVAYETCDPDLEAKFGLPADPEWATT